MVPKYGILWRAKEASSVHPSTVLSSDWYSVTSIHSIHWLVFSDWLVQEDEPHWAQSAKFNLQWLIAWITQRAQCVPANCEPHKKSDISSNQSADSPAEIRHGCQAKSVMWKKWKKNYNNNFNWNKTEKRNAAGASEEGDWRKTVCRRGSVMQRLHAKRELLQTSSAKECNLLPSCWKWFSRKLFLLMKRALCA